MKRKERSPRGKKVIPLDDPRQYKTPAAMPVMHSRRDENGAVIASMVSIWGTAVV